MPFLADGRTRRPTNRWPAGAYQDFQGWFHTLDAFEAGPVARVCQKGVPCGVAMAVRDADVPWPQPFSGRGDGRAREAMDSALLARPANLGSRKPRHPAVGDDDERITALVARHGGLRWERSSALCLRIAPSEGSSNALSAQARARGRGRSTRARARIGIDSFLYRDMP